MTDTSQIPSDPTATDPAATARRGPAAGRTRPKPDIARSWLLVPGTAPDRFDSAQASRSRS